MKFIKNMFRKWEFPTVEKLNEIIDKLNAHIKRNRSAFTDPGSGFEHWASSIQCDLYPDVQAALDNPPGTYSDKNIVKYVIAHSDDQQKYNADYYINDLRALETLGPAGSAYVFFVHNGIYNTTINDASPAITIPKNHIFIGESKAGVVFNVNRCRIQNTGITGGAITPLTFANITFKGSYQEMFRGNDFYLNNCDLVYKSSTIHASTGSALAQIGIGLFRTYNMSDPTPLESLLENVTFKILGPSAPGTASDRYYEYVKAIQHEYYHLILRKCAIDYFGADSILFHRGIYANPGATGILKIFDSKIITYDEAVYANSGELLIDRSAFGRLHT